MNQMTHSFTSIVKINPNSIQNEIDALMEMKHEDMDSIEVYTGIHPEYGAVHIIVPIYGISLIIPFANHSLTR
jgi:hypothetical protein